MIPLDLHSINHVVRDIHEVRKLCVDEGCQCYVTKRSHACDCSCDATRLEYECEARRPSRIVQATFYRSTRIRKRKILCKYSFVLLFLTTNFNRLESSLEQEPQPHQSRLHRNTGCVLSKHPPKSLSVLELTRRRLYYTFHYSLFSMQFY